MECTTTNVCLEGRKPWRSNRTWFRKQPAVTEWHSGDIHGVSSKSDLKYLLHITQYDMALFLLSPIFTNKKSAFPHIVQWVCTAVLCCYLAVQLLVQLADALCQLGQLLSDNSMVDGLGSVRLHIKILGQEISVTLCKHSTTSSECQTD